MKAKILYILNFLWTCLIAVTFPISFGWIYLDITGHAKGYSYDLGPEKEISILIGCIELIIWLALVLPSTIYVLRKTAAKGKRFLPIPLLLYLALALLCIWLMGGWGDYAKAVFNL